jgi:hypothetical protein
LLYSIAGPCTSAGVRRAGSRCFRLLFGTTPVPQSAAFVCAHGDRQDLPGSWAALREHALLFDPGGPNASGHSDASDVAFPTVDSVGSAIGHISRLNHTACSLAVYASQLGLLRSTPRKTRYPLTATLGGAGLEPAGLHSKVSLRNVTSHHVDPPSPSFAWRSKRRDAVTLATKQPARPAARSRAVPASHQS